MIDLINYCHFHEKYCTVRHNNRALRFCGACKSDDNGVRMLSTPFSLDCETTEAQISQEFGADDDEDDEIDCDIYEEPKCVAA